MEPKPPLGLAEVHRQLLELVRAEAASLPGARVSLKRNAQGEIVIAVVVPAASARR
jgi:hypothetical protein